MAIGKYFTGPCASDSLQDSGFMFQALGCSDSLE